MDTELLPKVFHRTKRILVILEGMGLEFPM